MRQAYTLCMVKVFHEVQSDKLEDVLLHGLLLGPGGDKRDRAIRKADMFLNGLRPKRLAEQGIDRDTNIYCYLSDGEKLVDIVSGKLTEPSTAVSSGFAMLKIEVDPKRCYVSDLDLYDQVKSLLDTDVSKAEALARIYWKKLWLLAEYDGKFRRPEVMVPYNIAPKDIDRIT